MTPFSLILGFNLCIPIHTYNKRRNLKCRFLKKRLNPLFVRRWLKDILAKAISLRQKWLPGLKCSTREDAVRQFEDSLARTGAGYFDNYLLHNLGEMRTHFFDDFDLWEFVKEKKAEGKIKHMSSAYSY